MTITKTDIEKLPKEARKTARYAIGYARNGLPVFPLQPGKKIPFKGSSGYKDHSTDQEEIYEWFQSNPRINIGMPTGPASGLIAIDLDFYKPGVVKAVRALVKKHGKFPHTLHEKTPRGGDHVLFRDSESVDITNKNSFPDGIDLRGRGGYLVMPPSTFKFERDGKQVVGKYEFVGKFDLNRVAELPEWCIPYLQPKQNAAGEYVAKSSSEWARLAEPVHEGGRNERLLAITGLLMRVMRPQAELAEALIHSHNQTKCIPPLSYAEVDNIISYVCDQELEKIKRLERKYPKLAREVNRG